MSEAAPREPVPLRLPQLGMAMLEGSVVAWLVDVGDVVAAGDALVEIEASKTNAELVAPVDGTIAEIHVKQGEMVPVNTVLATILPGDSEVPALSSAEDAAEVQPKKILSVLPAHRLAEEHGIDILSIIGTGPAGRITVDDVRAQIESQENSIPAADTVAVPMSAMRRSIADNMLSSLQNSAQLTLFRTIDVTEGVATRQAAAAGERPSMTATLVTATCRALAQHPQLNASVADSSIMMHKTVNIGIATALDEGLIVPVLHDVASRSLSETDEEVRRLVAGARTSMLSVDEVTGGTFTITSLGSQGIDLFTPILNPPQVAILGVGQIQDWPTRAPGGGLEWRQTMGVSLTIDHRVVDGAPGAAFLASLAEELGNRAFWATI